MAAGRDGAAVAGGAAASGPYAGRSTDVYVKDLGRLGRDLSQTIIVDNSPDAYAWHPENAVACTSWYGEDAPPYDDELAQITDWLERLDEAGHTDDVRPHLASFRERFPFTMVNG